MKLRVAVVFGGNSTEHEISIISAVQAMHSFDTEQYDVIPVYMSKESDFYTGTEFSEIETFRDLGKAKTFGAQVDFEKDGARVYLRRHKAKRFGENRLREIDIVFPIVHGTNTEDGTLTGFFVTLGLPVVGCDVMSSAVGMDKAVMKAVFKEAGIPVLPCLAFSGNDAEDIDTVVERTVKEFGYPVIVKPANLGSSIGITLAHDEEALRDGLELAFSLAGKVITERAITALREINCAVLGDGYDTVVSACEEPFGSGDILDFEDKYMSGGKGAKGTKSPGGAAKSAPAKASGKGGGMSTLSRKLPADIPDAMREEICETARRAFLAIGASGVSRIDFMIDTADNNKIYLNEINTIPGSLAFYLFEPVGISYPELLDRLVSIALHAEKEKQKRIFTFDTNVLAKAQV